MNEELKQGEISKRKTALYTWTHSKRGNELHEKESNPYHGLIFIYNANRHDLMMISNKRRIMVPCNVNEYGKLTYHQLVQFYSTKYDIKDIISGAFFSLKTQGRFMFSIILEIYMSSKDSTKNSQK